MTVCKNCNNTFEGKFCNNCGQKADTPRINLHYLWHEIQHGVFHLNKGVLYTFKELFVKPGHTIKDYINGKRVRHFKPFAYVFIIAGILSLLRHYLPLSEIHASSKIPVNNNEEHDIIAGFVDFAKTHLAVAQLILLPIYALGSWLVFRKSHYNFIEHIILNAFLAGQNLAFNIVFIPFLMLPKIIHISIINATITSIPNIYYLIIMIWGYFQFFNEANSMKTIFKTILKIILVFIVIIIVIILLLFVAFYLNILQK